MKAWIVGGAGLAGIAGAAALLLEHPAPTPEQGPGIARSATPRKLGVSHAAPVTTARAPNRETTLSEKLAEIGKLTDAAEKKRRTLELLADWTQRDPKGTADFVLAFPEEEFRKECMLRVMQTWAQDDPGKALSWAKAAAFDNDYEREVAMCMACTQVAKNDPSRAINLAIDYQLDQTADGLLEGLAAWWAKDDPGSARAWALQQPPGKQRDALVECIALAIFDENSDGAVRLVLEQIPAGENRDRAILSMLTRLAMQDPGAAHTWVDSFPAGPLRERAREDLNVFLNSQAGNVGQR